MKRISFIAIIFLFCLVNFLQAQTTTKYILNLTSRTTGQIVVGANVDLYQSGSKVYDLTEEAPGTYTHATVATGKYDVYVNGSALATHQGIFIGANKLTTIQGKFNDSGELGTSGMQDESVTSAKLANTLNLSGKALTYPDSLLEMRHLGPTLEALMLAGLPSNVYLPDEKTTQLQIAGSDTIFAVKDIDSISVNTGRVEFWEGGRKQVPIAVAGDTNTTKMIPAKKGDLLSLVELDTSNKNIGGGLFVACDSAEIYDSFGNSVFRSGVGFPSVPGIWYFRYEALQSVNSYPEWFGANPFDANDDWAAVQAAWDYAEDRQGNLIVSQGTYRMSAPLVSNAAIGSTTISENRPSIVGRGKNRSTLLFYNNTNGIVISGGLGSDGAWHGGVTIKDLSIEGSGAAGTAGIYADSSSTTIIDNNFIYNFDRGMDLVQTNGWLIQNNRIEDNGKYGIRLTVSPNELVMYNNYIGNSDSAQVFINSGNGLIIEGGAIFGENIDDTTKGIYGVFAESGAGVLIKSVPMERIKKYGLYTKTSARIVAEKVTVNPHVYEGKTNKFAGSSNGLLDISHSAHSGVSDDTTSIHITGTAAHVQKDNFSEFRTVWKPTTTEFQVGLGQFEQVSASSYSPSYSNQDNWLKFMGIHYRSGSFSDHLFIPIRMKDDRYFGMPIGNDHRVKSSDAQPDVERYAGREISGYVNFDYVATDSIVTVDVTIDTSNYNVLWHIVGQVNFRQIADTTDRFANTVWWADDTWTGNTGKAKAVIYFLGKGAANRPPDGTYRFHWNAYIRPNFWTE